MIKDSYDLSKLIWNKSIKNNYVQFVIDLYIHTKFTYRKDLVYINKNKDDKRFIFQNKNKIIKRFT